MEMSWRQLATCLGAGATGIGLQTPVNTKYHADASSHLSRGVQESGPCQVNVLTWALSNFNTNSNLKACIQKTRVYVFDRSFYAEHGAMGWSVFASFVVFLIYF